MDGPRGAALRHPAGLTHIRCGTRPHRPITERMRPPILLSLAALLLLPASASAATQTFGSDLSQPATLVQEHQADTAFWSSSLSGTGTTLVPVDGQIKAVRIKGTALRRPDSRPAGAPGGETMFHVQALDGPRFRITSQDFFLPTTGDPQQVSTYAPANFCVRAGERIAFNTVGGYDGVGAQPESMGGAYSPLSPYPNGTPLQIFARSAAATTPFYEQANGTDNGETMAPSGSGPREPGQGFVTTGTLEGQELLMQMTVATGDDRSYECGGPNTYRPADADPPAGTQPRPVFQKARIPEQRLRFSSKYKSALSLICAAGPGRCRGRLTVRAGKPSRVVAAARFDIAGKSAGRLSLRMTQAGRSLWNRSGRRLPARMTAVTGAGGPNYTDGRRVVVGKRGA